MVSAEVRRAEVAYAEIRGLSQGAACRLVSVPRSWLGYAARLPMKDAPSIARMKTLSAERPRWGYLLDCLTALHRVPRYLRCDNGSAFVTRTVVAWTTPNRVTNAFIAPGNHRTEAKVVIEAWRRDYNANRPHSAPGYLIPTEFKRITSQKTRRRFPRTTWP